MEHCRAAERALVAALVMGQVDPTELAGRLHPLDFTDPAAGACYAAALDHRTAGTAVLDLPERLRQRAALRSDGYPISDLLEWLPTLPVPAHPEGWATLVVAGALGRVVHACGTRLVQASVGPDGARPEAGRVLTVAAAARAALHGAVRRWDALPASWRDTLPVSTAAPAPAAGSSYVGEPVAQVLEREVLAGLVAAPVLLDRIPWLRAEDFTDPGVAEVFAAVRQLHGAGRPVDLITLSAHLTPAGEVGAPPPSPWSSVSSPPDAAVAVCGELRPEQALLATVPFLARRLVEDAAVREAQAAGEALVSLAAAPGSAGGLGRGVLDAALRRLDGLRPYAARLEQAHRPALPRGRDRVRPAPARLPAPRGPVDARQPG
jgi:replicative DNA helicase